MAKRPELRGHIESLRMTITVPDIVVRTDDGCDHFYARGHGTGPLSSHYLHVLVREFSFVDDTEHTVVSAWFTRSIEEGVWLWPKRP